MQTLKNIDPASATGKNKQIFDGLQKNLGTVPNMMRALGNSPAALNAYMTFNSALSEGALSAKTREQLAIAIANANSCDYCLSAHNALGKLTGLSSEDLALAQHAEAADQKTAAALRFAVEVVRNVHKLLQSHRRYRDRFPGCNQRWPWVSGMNQTGIVEDTHHEQRAYTRKLAKIRAVLSSNAPPIGNSPLTRRKSCHSSPSKSLKTNYLPSSRLS